jgi:hypothetical protein
MTELVKLLRANEVHTVHQDGDHEVWRIGEGHTYAPKHEGRWRRTLDALRDAGQCAAV